MIRSKESKAKSESMSNVNVPGLTPKILSIMKLAQETDFEHGQDSLL